MFSLISGTASCAGGQRNDPAFSIASGAGIQIVVLAEVGCAPTPCGACVVSAATRCRHHRARERNRQRWRECRSDSMLPVAHWLVGEAATLSLRVLRSPWRWRALGSLQCSVGDLLIPFQLETAVRLLETRQGPHFGHRCSRSYRCSDIPIRKEPRSLPHGHLNKAAELCAADITVSTPVSRHTYWKKAGAQTYEEAGRRRAPGAIL
jgi:hypothetical protein